MPSITRDLANILRPLPREGEVEPAELYDDALEHTAKERENFEWNLETAWDEGGIDPVLGSIREARARMTAAENEIRLLLAYAREFTGGRPYKLATLAEAAGMSASGVRTAYGDAEIDEVASSLGRRPSEDGDG